MQIDWVTVAAQIVNFLVLVWLLHRFLYGPVTRAMQRREDTIRDRLAEARRMQDEAAERAGALAAEHDALAAARDRILDAAREEAHALKQRLEREIRDEIEQSRAAWQAELEEHRAAVVAAIRDQAREGFRQVAGDALTSLAGVSLASRMAAVLSDRLAQLSGDDLARLRDAAAREGGVRISLAAPLDRAARDGLAAAVRAVLAPDTAVRFEDQPGRQTGIRLSAGGETVQWSIEDYLDRFAERLHAAFPGDPRHVGAPADNAPGDGAPQGGTPGDGSPGAAPPGADASGADASGGHAPGADAPGDTPPADNDDDDDDDAPRGGAPAAAAGGAGGAHG